MSGRVQRPAGTPPGIIRLAADPRVTRAERDWTRDGHGWRSSNGWEVRRVHVAPSSYVPGQENAWGAFAPDGVPEWWADDPATAMERAEGCGA